MRGAKKKLRPVACALVAALLGACAASDDEFAKVVVGTWGSREVAPDDVIVENRFTLLPGGRVNWQGELRMLVPADDTKPWMRYAGMVESGDPRSSARIDEIVYGQKG